MDSNAGVHNPNVVDLVTHDPRSDEFVLIMVEIRPWDGSSTRLLELQAKINHYLSFVLDGQMERVYPDSKGKPVRMQLDCAAAPDEETARFIDLVRDQLAQYGVRLTVNVLP